MDKSELKKNNKENIVDNNKTQKNSNNSNKNDGLGLLFDDGMLLLFAVVLAPLGFLGFEMYEQKQINDESACIETSDLGEGEVVASEFLLIKTKALPTKKCPQIKK